MWAIRPVRTQASTQVLVSYVNAVGRWALNPSVALDPPGTPDHPAPTSPAEELDGQPPRSRPSAYARRTRRPSVLALALRLTHRAGHAAECCAHHPRMITL